jgi:hypothetical protein
MRKFKIPERYSETYDTLNKNVQEYTVNAINFVNKLLLVVLKTLINH